MNQYNFNFDKLPQNFLLNIDSQFNNFKKMTQANCVQKKKNSYIYISLLGQHIGCTLIHLKRKMSI